MPINLKICLEGMEESGSVKLDETVRARTDFFGNDVDWVCISDNYFLGQNKPCLTYGLRGCAYFNLEVECASQDLHSGVGFYYKVYNPEAEFRYLVGRYRKQ